MAIFITLEIPASKLHSNLTISILLSHTLTSVLRDDKTKIRGHFHHNIVNIFVHSVNIYLLVLLIMLRANFH